MMQNTLHKQTAKLIAAIAQNLPEIPADAMQNWIQNPKALQKALMEALCPHRNLKAVVDYQLPVSILMECGGYRFNDRNPITEGVGDELFPIPTDGLWEISYEIIQPNRIINSYDAVTEIKNRGFESASLKEMLTFGSQYPEIKLSLVALGSFIFLNRERCVQQLNNDTRVIDIVNWFISWTPSDCFLAVSKRQRLT